jgi:hypothetical protein
MGIADITPEHVPTGWAISVQIDDQVDFLRDEQLEGEDRRRSVVILEKPYRYEVICLAGYGEDGNPTLASGVRLGRALRIAQAEMRAVNAGHPTSVPVEQQETEDENPAEREEEDSVDDVEETTEGQAGITEFF